MMLRQVVLVGFVLSCSGVALAQDDPSAAETAAARTLAIEGMKLAEAGQCEEAVKKLERALKLHYSPIVASRLGDCLVNLGRLVEGTEALRKMLREPLPANPSPALKQAHERAQTVLDATKPKLGMLIIDVEMPANTEAMLLVDGKPLPAVVIGTDLPVDPGEHAIEVSANGFFKASTRVMVGSGEKQSVTLKLERDPNAPVAAPGAAAAPPETSAANAVEQKPPAAGASTSAALDRGVTPSAPDRTAAYIALGIGAVGLGVGLGFGAVAMKDKSELDDECPNDACPPSSSDRIDQAKTMGNISTIGFGVAGAGAVLGTILLLASGSSSDRARAPAVPAPRLRPRAFIGLGSVAVSADF